jgi:pyridoxine 5-phosphate synthase
VNKHSPLILGVNIDHIATVRQARRATFPDPMQAVQVAESYGADSITVHLREDRRHIQDADVFLIRDRMMTRMNLEMAATSEMVGIALKVKPADVCLVPEKRTEVTTEGGLDVRAQRAHLTEVVQTLSAAGIRVSMFIDPVIEQIEAVKACGAPVIELHTGAYADHSGAQKDFELKRLQVAAQAASEMGLVVNAGHGLDYYNVAPVAAIKPIVELNIGFAIIAHALFVGLGPAVAEMKTLMMKARST